MLGTPGHTHTCHAGRKPANGGSHAPLGPVCTVLDPRQTPLRRAPRKCDRATGRRRTGPQAAAPPAECPPAAQRGRGARGEAQAGPRPDPGAAQAQRVCPRRGFQPQGHACPCETGDAAARGGSPKHRCSRRAAVTSSGLLALAVMTAVARPQLGPPRAACPQRDARSPAQVTEEGSRPSSFPVYALLFGRVPLVFQGCRCCCHCRHGTLCHSPGQRCPSSGGEQAWEACWGTHASPDGAGPGRPAPHPALLPQSRRPRDSPLPD